MDNFTSSLVAQLLDKAMENTQPKERLAFVEKLFGQLSPQGQQDFLISLTHSVLNSGDQFSQAPCGPQDSGPSQVHFVKATPEDFAPGQICCQALTGLAREDSPNDQQVIVVAQMFNGLADETRVKIVKLLAKGEFTVDELVEFLGTAQSTTSHHLRVLKDANLIKGEKRGRNIYYSLVKPGVAAVEASLPLEYSKT